MKEPKKIKNKTKVKDSEIPNIDNIRKTIVLAEEFENRIGIVIQSFILENNGEPNACLAVNTCLFNTALNFSFKLSEKGILSKEHKKTLIKFVQGRMEYM